MTTAQVEKQLNELRKLPENKECLNCLSVSKIGHGNVCVPFKTFVCSDCKSAHQAYSHRIKSLTMSTWTQDDVDALKPKNGGSNKNAEAKYFARYDDRRLPRPRKGDDHTVWKDFVQQVYNEKRFYDDQGGDSDQKSSRASDNSPPRRSDRDDNDYRPSHNSNRRSSRDRKDTDDRKYPANDRHTEGGTDRQQYAFYDDNMYSSRGSGRENARHETSSYGGSRVGDREDGEVRSRRKDVSKARGRAGRESERPAPKQQSNVQGLLGGLDGEADIARFETWSSIKGSPDGADGWADFQSGGQATHLAAEPAVARTDMFVTAPTLVDVFGSSTTSQPHAPPAPKADILSMYNTNSQQQPVHGGSSGMGTGFPGMMPMAGVGVPTYMGARPGMGGANMMQSMGGANMNTVQGMGGANMNMMPGMSGANPNMMQGTGRANMNMMQNMGGANLNMMQGMGGANLNMMQGMGGANVNTMQGMGGANLNTMQGMGGTNKNMMQVMGGANKMQGMGGGVGVAGAPMRPTAPSTQHSAMGASIMAAAHQPGGVFGGSTPQKQASQDKFTDLRW